MLVSEEEDRAAAGQELDDTVREVVGALGPKEAAFILGISIGYLSNTLAKRENRNIPATWLPALDAADPEHRIAKFFARRLGCRLEEIPDERSPEEKLRDLLAVLRRSGETGHNLARAAGVRL